MNSLKKLTCLCGLIAFALSACGGVKRIPAPIEPTERPWRAPMKSCRICLESETFTCPISDMQKLIKGSIGLWDSLKDCKIALRRCGTIATIDKAELQGRVNTEAARADKNARWIWYTVAGGLVLTVVSFVLGAVAF